MDTLWVFEASDDQLRQHLVELQASTDDHARCAVQYSSARLSRRTTVVFCIARLHVYTYDSITGTCLFSTSC
jgi:hypothetical protein